jgi:hypothetical protein
MDVCQSPFEFIYVECCFECSGHVAKMEEGRNAFRILTGKPTGIKGRMQARGI